MAYRDEKSGQENCIGYKLPHTQEDWHAKRRAIDTVMRDIKGVCRARRRRDGGRDVVAL